MSLALLALSACTFALGFAEFVAVSLVPSIAAGTHLSVGSVGMMIGIYAIGVSIGAPTLSAILARAPRRRVLATSMLLFAFGNLTSALTTSLPMLLGSRLLAGLMHGVVLALASSTAAAAVGPERSGNAIATVFGGLTVALMLGVPLGTLAGGYFRWQDVFIAIAFIGSVSSTALMLFTPAVVGARTAVAADKPSVWATVSDTATLQSVATTALTYAGSFTGFTYVSVLLQQVTHLSASGITGMFALYGVSAALGNAIGGRFVDSVGSRLASCTVVAGLVVALGGAYLGGPSTVAMSGVMIVWGLASFAAVPILQKTVLVAAQQNRSGSPEVASGMSIAAFNVGIAVGSVLGGFASKHSPDAPMLAALLPLILAGLFASRLARHARSRMPAASNLTNHGV